MNSTIQNLQFKRGTKSANDALIGPRGSISIDFETGSIRIHDGVTPGGAFTVKQGAVIGADNLEFQTATETRTAGTGQTTFSLNIVQAGEKGDDLAGSTVVKLDTLQVKVNGELVTSGFTVTDEYVVKFNTALNAGDVVTFSTVESLQTLVQYAVANSSIDVSAAIRSALEQASSIGGISLDSILTVNDRIDCGVIN